MSWSTWSVNGYGFETSCVDDKRMLEFIKKHKETINRTKG